MDSKLLPLVVFCYFLYTSVTSFILSLVLLIRYTLGQFYGFFASRVDDDTISLYEGTVIHDRRHPVNHYFKTPIRFALIDLDRSSYIPPNHLSSKETRSIAGTNGPVLLLTMPPSVGYQRSPFSLYYCYDLQESSSKILKYCIAEVTNTPWGEQAQFIFNPNSDLVAKSLHISPFMDMLGDWHMKAKSPGNNLSVSILVKHPELGNYFTASLTANKILLTSNVDYALFFWLKPQIGAILTYWQIDSLGRPRGDVLSKFEDIFQWKDGGFRGDVCLKNSSLERYSLVMKKRNVFHCKESTTMITFRVSYVPKAKIWVKFHDYDNDNRAGNFKNISANCLLYYVVYECHTHNIFSPNVNSCISY